MRVLLVTLSLTAIALAGCTDTSNDPSENPGGLEDLPNGLEAPTWAVGDYWRYQGPTNEFRLIVTEETATGWVIDTDDDTIAFYEDQFGPISYMGEQRKGDYAGSQDAAVKFFDWPLQDGKEWTMYLDGFDHQVTAQQLSETRYEMTATLDGVVRAQYTYSDEVRWFERFEWFDEEGNSQFAISRLEEGRGYSGPYLRIEAEPVIQFAAQAGASSSPFDIPPSTDADLYLFYTVSCPAGDIGPTLAYTFALGPVENVAGQEAIYDSDDGFNDSSTCPHFLQYAGVIGSEPNEGNWGYVAEAPPGASYGFQLWLRHYERFTL